MVVTLKKSGDTFTFSLPPQAVEELALVDGSTIEVRPTANPEPHTIRYAAAAEAIAAYEATRPEYDEVYRELAK